jgi:hypothetical protein
LSPLNTPPGVPSSIFLAILCGLIRGASNHLEDGAKKLADGSFSRFNWPIMKATKLCGIIAAGVLAFATAAEAGGPKTYQATGPVLEVNDSMIAVQNGKARWEIGRDANTKVTGDPKVGGKVTIFYKMTATAVEAKTEKGAKNP